MRAPAKYTLRLRRVHLDRGGYARSGANVYPGRYFGTGAPVYEYELLARNPIVRVYEGTVRAGDRAAARAAIQRLHGV